MPRVTVIVPTYNSEVHLVQTLDSILAQSYQDLELIVVDDGSTDGTCAALAPYGERLRLLRQANAGVSSARNRGLAAARGEFVCFVDHDDYWFEDKLALQLAEFERDPALGVVFSAFTPWLPDGDGRYAEPSSLRDQTAGLDPHWTGWVYHRLLIDNWVLTSSALVRRSVLDQCGGFDEALPYGEDWELWLRVSRHYRFAKLRRVTTLYRQLAGQGSRRFRPIDYRTRLLSEAVARWGYASPDGSALPEPEFRRQLARYHLAYGLHCLQAAEASLARAAFRRAWRQQPHNLRPLLYLAAASLGWRPTW